MFKMRFKKIDELFQAAKDAHVFQDRKTVIMDGKILGYRGSVMVYSKASVSEVRLGYLVAEGWTAQEVVRNPKNRFDGFVVCTEDM